MNGTAYDTPSNAVEVYCSNCRLLLVVIPNRWWQVTKSHVTFLPEENIQDDIYGHEAGFARSALSEVSVGAEDFDGSGELRNCILRILECRDCGRRLGIKCTLAPDEKAQHRSCSPPITSILPN